MCTDVTTVRHSHPRGSTSPRSRADVGRSAVPSGYERVPEALWGCERAKAYTGAKTTSHGHDRRHRGHHTDTTVGTEAITRTRPSARARMGATRLPSRLTRSRRSLVRPSRGFASRLALARGSAARESLDATRRAPRGSIDTASGGSVDTAFGRPIDTAFGGSVGPFRRSPWSARSTRSGRPRRR